MALQNIDKAEFLSINRFAKRTPGLHGIMRFLSNEGVFIFIAFLIVAYLLVRFIPKWTTKNNMVKIAITGVGTVIAVGINQPLTHIFKEPRPFNSLPHILVLINRVHDYSFPSDHGVMVGAVTAGLYLINPILGTISLIIGLLIAFSRVYTAAHYPHDLIAGMIVGSVVVLLLYVLTKKPVAKLMDWLEKTPLKVFIGGNSKQNTTPSET
jgi:undecaprenyl-diphosphatase